MRAVSYTRSTSSVLGDDIPKNVIGIQNEHIIEFANAKGWSIYKKYSDRKIDTEEDAAFQEMLSDGISRKFDMVLVDSVYRTGKNLGSAKEVLLQTFHMAGICFSVVEDEFCSIDKSNEEVEAYFESKYTAYRKITMMRRMAERNSQGMLSWNDVKYGYHLSADCQLEIDDETASVVKRIFKECAMGKDINQIAQDLRNDLILCPLAKRGVNVEIADPYKWTSYGVKRIIRNTAYCGHWIKVFKGQEFPMECTPIVTRELFEEANSKIVPAPSPQSQRVKNKFAGLILDEKLKPTMRYRENKFGERYFYTMTGLRHNNPRIYLEEVESILREHLKREYDFALFVQERIREEGQHRIDDISVTTGAKIASEAMKVADLEKRRISLYRDRDRSATDAEAYENYMESYVTSFNRTEETIKAYEKLMADAEIMYSDKNPWMKLFLKYGACSELDKELLRACVQRVVFRKVEIIRIDFKMSEWRDNLPEEWRREYGSNK